MSKKKKAGEENLARIKQLENELASAVSEKDKKDI